MATNSGFTLTLPSNQSAASGGAAELRSQKSYMKAWWEEEHYALDGSASSAGEHKPGSARVYSFASVSELSNPVLGRVAVITDDNSLYVASASTWQRVTSATNLDSINTWTEDQIFTDTLSAQSGLQVGSAGTHLLAVESYETAFPSGTVGAGSFNEVSVSVTTASNRDFVVVNPGFLGGSARALPITARASGNELNAYLSNASNTDQSYSTLTVRLLHYRFTP